MTRWMAGLGLLGTLLGVAECERETPVELAESEACAQTSEFANHGCARLVVMVEAPPPPWPAGRRLDVRAVPAREGTGADLSLAPYPGIGAVPLG